MNDIFSVSAAPEQMGIASEDIERLIDIFADNHLSMHGFIMLRHGVPIAEGYWKPFHEKWLHRIYSSGKTIAALAVGILAGEGKIKLTDRAVDYFPDKLDATPDPLIAAMTIRDMLMMATPFSRDVYTYGVHDRIHAFLQDKPLYPAGTKFAYNTSATYTLTAIVERVSGQCLLDYLRPRLFDPIGVSKEIRLLTVEKEYSHPGSGFICTLRDFAKLTRLVENRGNWNGVPLVPAAYMAEMTSKQIDNGTPVGVCSGSGYGYQLWMLRGENRFTYLGMGDQLGMCFADRDICFVCMADNQGNDRARAIIFETVEDIVNRASDVPLKENPEAYARLQSKLKTLTLSCPSGNEMPVHGDIIGRRFVADGDNPMKITEFTVERDRLIYTNMQGEKVLPFAVGNWKNIEFPQTGYPDGDYFPSDNLYPCLSAAAWTEDGDSDIFTLRVNAIGDSIGNLTVWLCFHGKKASYIGKRGAQFFFDEYQGKGEFSAATGKEFY